MPRQVSNPPTPWASTAIEWLEAPPAATLGVFEEEARSMLSENDSPDLPFRWSLNPYRGCLHACAYCYARPSHQYLGWGAGTDFDRKIVVKTNAPEMLRKELLRPSWQGELIMFSGITDCYQPLEASYALTRRCLEVCAELRNPVRVITKGALIRRDADILRTLVREAQATVHLSIAFARDDIARQMEPYASRPSIRFEAMRALSDAGIPTGIGLAPVIPGLNDTDIPELLERAKQAGASQAFMTLLRLPREVLPVFQERLEESFPERARKVWSQLGEARGGKIQESDFGKRFAGRGPRWQVIEQLFETHCQRLGLNQDPIGEARTTTFRRPFAQQKLFDI
jgi:DNA repair photolyase